MFFTSMKQNRKNLPLQEILSGVFVLSGDAVEKLFKMTDFSRDDSVKRFARQLRGMGIDEALREKGAKDGDIVKLLEFEFEFIE